ncbi:MAG: protease modulator HflC [Clostridiaceae bacterium]|nr:protease modulator HflC [Clostridiales bacterium]MDD2441985.1 protease modulator HflC [Eubacteriales bacterium]MDD4744884.1 protease modulator HflC [Eubacteriales bacterium]NLB44679.1 protease modulator HflC [Clostridiaceae bacterium]
MKKWIIIAVVVLLALIGVSNSVYTVQEGEFAYITQFGALVSIHPNAGLAFKIPFIQDVNRLTKKQMIYNVNSSEVLTADKKAMIVDSYSIWKIVDVTTFIRTVNNIGEMQKRIDASTYSVIKNLMGQLEQSEIISDGEASRTSLNNQITEQVAASLMPYGVEILSVEVKRFDLPEDNTTAVYARMISERSQMAASYKAEGEYEAAKIRNETDKEIEITIGQAEAAAQRLRGEGEEEYMRILKELYNDPAKAEFYLFVRELEAMKKSLQGEKTLILGSDSPLAKIINQVND